MTNEEILKKRWKEVDKKTIKLSKKRDNLNKELQDDLQMYIDSLKITSTNFNKNASKTQKERANRLIDKIISQDKLQGYLKYYATNIRNKTNVKNSELLRLVIYIAYTNESINLKGLEDVYFEEITNLAYTEAQQELRPNKKVSLIPYYVLASLLMLENAKGYIWEEYKQASLISNADQVYRQASIVITQDRELDINDNNFQDIFRAQRNRYLKINENSISGDLDIEAVGLYNGALLSGYEKYGANDGKVRFIAEMDSHTTQMCQTLDNQVFNIKGFNTYYRYSASDNKSCKYVIEGLKLGENLPPINNHFHWCRSTITYLHDNEQATNSIRNK